MWHSENIFLKKWTAKQLVLVLDNDYLLMCFKCFQDIRSQFENCLADGSALLVTDCDTEELAKDKRFRDAIQSCKRFINGKMKFKIVVSNVFEFIIETQWY